ncbi:hypothetical protein EG347_13300 [Chryseobacterium sp. G0186]|nr:hypothetical protein EG347_13300 [Chryseobacterium sp. G0186]
MTRMTMWRPFLSPDCSGYPAASLKGERGVIAESGKQLQIKIICYWKKFLNFIKNRFRGNVSLKYCAIKNPKSLRLRVLIFHCTVIL